MPRLLALEWNDDEARVAVATSRGGRVAFEHAFVVDLRSEPSDAEAAEVDVGERIATALGARHLGRTAALVAVGRSDVELRRLSLPPAPDDELPELVRFQSMREFNALGEDWPLDFLPLDEDAEQARNVLAAAINPERVDAVCAICRTAGLKPARMVLRPCAAASLVGRQRPAEPGQIRLVVDLLVDEADLTVMIGDRTVFLRRARLRGDPLASSAAAEVLASETRRTIMAAQNQVGVREVDSIVLCGAGPEHAALAESLREQLPAPLELFDPFEGLRLEGDLRRALPDRSNRFAPLLGMLRDELEGTPHALDFLNPRRRPEPPSRRNIFTAAGLAAALVVLLLLGYGWLQSRWLEADIAELTSKSKDLDVLVERATKINEAVDAVEAWRDREVVWLDELRWLSDNLPEAEDAMLTKLTLSVVSGRAEIIVDGQAKSPEAATRLDRQLQDASHRLYADTKRRDESKSPYPMQFKNSLLLGSEEK